MRLALRAAAAAVIAWVAFAFRFQSPDFHNDHFEHLSMARQVLFGELPGRDFFDPGRPLTVLLSAGAQALFGHSLFGEALLTIGALALGAAITFWLASAVARSTAAGAVAALVVIAIIPRLYSYPKIIVFAGVLAVLWRYVDRPNTSRAVALAVVTVFALLMRHDFGLYVGIVSLFTLLLVRLKPDTASRPIATYLIALVLLVAPYLVWMQMNGLLAASASGGATSLAGAARLTWRPLRIDLSQGLVHIDPVRGRVTVRWSSATTAETQADLERKYHLVLGHIEGPSTWSYGLTDDTRDNIRALVADAHVDDTGGINRGAATLEGSTVSRWVSRTGLSRVVVQPPFTSGDAEAWLYAGFWLIPVAAFCVLAVQGRRHGLSAELIKVASAALLGVLLNLFLLRGSLDSRLPDVVVPGAIVGAWLLAEALRALRRAAVPWRFAAATGMAAIVLVLGSAVAAYSGVTARSLLRGPSNPSGLRDVAQVLRRRPIDLMSADEGVPRLTHYVFDCTAPRDRLLLVAYEPQVFYYSERLFAGGIEHFHQRRFSSAAEQSQIVAALGQQKVPLVIVDDERFRMLQDDYASVFAYIRGHYVPVGETRFNAKRLWRIYADPQTPVRRKWDDLPCFAD